MSTTLGGQSAAKPLSASTEGGSGAGTTPAPASNPAGGATTTPLIGTPGNQGNAVEELDVYGDVPMARFGHTITLVSKTKVVLFGGATGDTGKYSMTGETYLFNILTKTWSKLNGKSHSRLAVGF
jgi:hypothetical protein